MSFESQQNPLEPSEEGDAAQGQLGSQPAEGQGDETPGPDEVAQRPAKKPIMPASRIAFLIFVAASVVVITIEFRARWSYTRTVQTLDQAWDAAQQNGTGIYRADLEKLVRGSPSRARDQQQRTETFTWRGVFAYRLEATYSRGEFLANYRTLKRGM